MDLRDLPSATGFSGSYAPHDCQFLLTPLALEPTPTAEKEALIQSGAHHYSEFHTGEAAPDPAYTALFRALTEQHARRIAGDIVALAQHIAGTRLAPLTVVSLVRAGTPIGALLTRALRRHDPFVAHYAISIIRDRGIDTNALRHILRVAGRPAAGLVFLDGWTAKGVIGAELRTAIGQWNAHEPEQLDPSLYVLADIAGQADVAASYDDYAIPSGILNATVSGLVSRSIRNDQLGPEDFDGCVYYDHLAPLDQSEWFLYAVSKHFDTAHPRPLDTLGREGRARLTRAWIERCMALYGITDINFVKPGVAEATRVLLRRVPDRVILRDPQSPEVTHLLALADARGVTLERDPAMPFEAVSLIRALRGTPARSCEP